ncbi:hypothetical protein J2128_001902 [Methanomicrobium sp. W14]|uniref:hypothetical protein n=1 Tax=Methanomicrobium sp. W14 TaxID=2817839 RepID=UPI001AE5B42D|nr:hypothetical protein [Methanomicrobium sp. W14]MBP2133936.1 hypothetical protein [Methanomicrobium sp. W14]
MLELKGIIRKLEFAVIIAVILFSCFFAGCVDSSGNGNNIGVDDSVNCNETFVSQERINDSPEGSHAEYMNLSQNFTLPDKTKSLIKALFPKIMVGTIQNPKYISSAVVPDKKYLYYSNVDSTDDMSYEIEFDPNTYDIIFCSLMYSQKSKKAEKKISFDDAKKISSDFLKVLVSNSSENYLDGYLNSSVYINYFNTESNDNSTACGVDLTYNRVINGVSCFESTIQIEVDSVTGDVISFYEYWPDLSEYKFSSPNPDYSLEYSQGLAESTINEKYPGEVKSYGYKSVNGSSDDIKPLWFDDEILLKYEKDKPIDLVWVFYLIPDLNAGYSCGQNQYLEEISAHTGEIYALYYNDIHIYFGDKYWSNY